MPAVTTPVSTATTLATVATTTITPMTMIMVAIPSVPAIAQDTFFPTDKVGVQVSFRKHLTLTDPDLDPDLPVDGEREHIRIVDIHPQRMQRRTTLLDLLRTGDLGAAQPAGNLDLDPFCTHPERGSDRHLDSTLIVDTILDLAGNGVTNDVGVQFRATDLQDIDLDIILACQLLQFFLDAIDLAATLADNDTGLGSVDRYDEFIQRTLDHDLGNPPLIDTGIQVGSDLVILDQLGSIIFFAAIPVGFPTADDP